jgi:dTDP-4-dehydrorhamnose 3,5-epimerase
MKFTKTGIEGLWIVSPVVHGDGRGFFLESFSAREFESQGIAAHFVQDNHSRSTQAGVLRGMHFQRPPFAQSKFVRVTRGSVYDVVVDLRKGSATYGQWRGFTLSDENKEMLFIPKGLAHGYCTLSAESDFFYKVDAFYSPQHDAGIRFDDPAIGIQWPVPDPVLSEKDKKLPFLSDIESPF